MMLRTKWPEAEIALVFIRPVRGLSEEIQLRMIEKAVLKLGMRYEVYQSPLTGDKTDQRGRLLRLCRGTEVVVVARLNVLGRTGVEVSTTVSTDFVWFVGELKSKCKYILVLDDNLEHTPPNSPVTSEDGEWKEVLDRATNVVSNSRVLKPEVGKKMAKARWAGTFRGVLQEWTENPERAKDRENMARIWRDTKYPNAQTAYSEMPEEVRAQIKSLKMCYDIFGPRRPDKKNIGRPPKIKND